MHFSTCGVYFGSADAGRSLEPDFALSGAELAAGDRFARYGEVFLFAVRPRTLATIDREHNTVLEIGASRIGKFDQSKRIRRKAAAENLLLEHIRVFCGPVRRVTGPPWNLIHFIEPAGARRALDARPRQVGYAGIGMVRGALDSELVADPAPAPLALNDSTDAGLVPIGDAGRDWNSESARTPAFAALSVKKPLDREHSIEPRAVCVLHQQPPIAVVQ
jgi:hypothetical protein